MQPVCNGLGAARGSEGSGVFATNKKARRTSPRFSGPRFRTALRCVDTKRATLLRARSCVRAWQRHTRADVSERLEVDTKQDTSLESVRVRVPQLGTEIDEAGDMMGSAPATTPAPR